MTRSRLATIYNDKSVLENYHCCRVFELLEIGDCNIISSLSSEEYKKFRRIAIDVILGTDMSSHFDIAAKFLGHVESNKGFNEPEAKLMLSCILVHAADISNVAKPFEISKKWSDRVFEEFLNQGDLEKANAMTISPYMDRNNTNQAKMNIGFSGNKEIFIMFVLDFVCRPLFVALASFSPHLKEFVENIDKNREKWMTMKESDLAIPQPSGAYLQYYSGKQAPIYKSLFLPSHQPPSHQGLVHSTSYTDVHQRNFPFSPTSGKVPQKTLEKNPSLKSKSSLKLNFEKFK
jgi:hypothetical protein